MGARTQTVGLALCSAGGILYSQSSFTVVKTGFNPSLPMGAYLLHTHRCSAWRGTSHLTRRTAAWCSYWKRWTAFNHVWVNDLNALDVNPNQTSGGLWSDVGNSCAWDRAGGPPASCLLKSPTEKPPSVPLMNAPTHTGLVPPKNSIQEQLFKLINEIKGLILRARELRVLGGTVKGWWLWAVPLVCSTQQKKSRAGTEFVRSIPINWNASSCNE